MKLVLDRLLLFVLTVYGQTTGRTGVEVHIYVDVPMNCTSAQNHCKAYKSMSVITNNGDLWKLEEAAGGTYTNSWIRNLENSCKSLKYEDTNTLTVLNLFIINRDCAIANVGSWVAAPCSQKNPFFCYENVILVKENKTWEEALEHCRSLYTDLASFNFRWPQNQIKSETSNTQTDSVWTGLRFLHGTWNWMNSVTNPVVVSLPSCPTEPHRCGARNTRTERWENRDCEEKLNFLCVQR